MSIDITASGVSMDEVAKDEDPGYRPDREPSKPVNSGTNSEYPNLLAGGVPGNKGGSGRPPSEARAKNRELHHDAADELAVMLSDHKKAKQDPATYDRLSVGEVKNIHESSGRYGLGSTISYSLDEREVLKLCIETVERLYPGLISATKVIDSVMEQLK